MTARNVVRLVITAFIVVVITIATTGWVWVGAHQAPRQAVASRVVLTLAVLAGLIGMKAVWTRRA